MLQAYDPEYDVVIPNGTPVHDFLYKPICAFKWKVHQIEDKNKYVFNLFEPEVNDKIVVVIT